MTVAPYAAAAPEANDQPEENDLYLESNFYKRIDELVILPNQTFILQQSKKLIQFPQDSTPLLRHTIQLLNPMQSF